MEINYFDSVQRVKREYNRILEPVCQQWSLTRNEVDILLFLHNNPEFDRAADIVAGRGIAKSHVSLSVNTLEQKGYLDRITDPVDRRTIHLKLTEASSPITQQARFLQQKFFAFLHQDITPEEMETWRTVAKKIEINIQNLVNLK